MKRVAPRSFSTGNEFHIIIIIIIKCYKQLHREMEAFCYCDISVNKTTNALKLLQNIS